MIYNFRDLAGKKGLIVHIIICADGSYTSGMGTSLENKTYGKIKYNYFIIHLYQQIIILDRL
jgi:hypothetical protein